MEFYTGDSFWNLSEKNTTKNYSNLRKNIECDVLIVGGGITGALCSYYMNKSNIDTVLIDKNTFASGSTMINTSLLHYEIDINLYNLSKIYNKNIATRYFQLCRKALYDLKVLLNKTKIDANFIKRKSLHAAKNFNQNIQLIKEYNSRKSAGFKVTYVSKKIMKNHFDLPYYSGIYSFDGGEINPYLLAHNLIDYSTEHGLQAFENTELIYIDYKKGYNIAYTPNHTIKTKKIIFATGYEADPLVDKYTTTTFYNTYTLITKPLTDKYLWKDNCLIWEGKHPNCYLRTTKDNRIIIGGLDTPYKGFIPNRKLLEKKSNLLYKKLNHLLPHLNIEKAFYSAGIYADTKDSIGYIGEVPLYPNCYFILGYGTNGIIYSIIGSQIIKDLYKYGYHQDAHLFSFYR
ncbi:MAG: NAD(P)/FAD-dependent oxidoreductase [Eubacteriales bacterium]